MTQTVTIPATAIRQDVIDAVRMVGKVVTYCDEQFKIYSVEGVDFYAYNGTEADGGPITLDFFDAPSYRQSVYAFLLPTDCKIGEGFGFEVPLSQCKPGVSLAKW